MKIQKSIVLTPQNKEELDSWLRQSWTVVQTCPMPSFIYAGQAYYPPTCLVIIQSP